MSKAPVKTVPCQYKTGKVLGSEHLERLGMGLTGSAVVKEAVHIETGKYYACKVLSKAFLKGREHMVRNEITVLKRVSAGHRNIVQLHDYFETSNNLYLVFDLCTGGELFDRICARGSYYERDAAHLIRTIAEAVSYLHSQGIVHRDLKPENLLFRDKAEDADLCLADFGVCPFCLMLKHFVLTIKLSKVLEEDQFQLLSTTCGTPGYMAPEIFKKAGHGKPVDIWAIGVITYFLLCGYTPFDAGSPAEEMNLIVKGQYKFAPEEYWTGVSEQARDFVRKCLTVDPTNRPKIAEVLSDPWLKSASQQATDVDLLPNVKSGFDAKKTWRKAMIGVVAVARMNATFHSGQSDAEKAKFAEQVERYKAEAESEDVKDVLVTSLTN